MVRFWSPRRALLAGVVAVAAIVTAGCGFAWATYREAQDHAREDAGEQARATASELDRFIADRVLFLQALARTDPVVHQDLPATWALFGRALGEGGLVDDLGWVDAGGRARVLAKVPLDQAAGVDLGDRDYVQAVLRTGQPYVGRAVLGKLDASPTVVIAVPTRDASGAISGVLTGPVLLDRRTPSLDRLVATGENVRVVDRAGQLIVDDGPVTVLRPADAGTGLVDRLRRDGAGAIVDGDGLFGPAHALVGFATVPSADWLVLTRSSTDVAFASARDELTQKLLAWIGLGVATGVLAVVLSVLLDRARRRQDALASLMAALLDAGSPHAVLEATRSAVAVGVRGSAEIPTDESTGSGPVLAVPVDDGPPLRFLVAGRRRLSRGDRQFAMSVADAAGGALRRLGERDRRLADRTALADLTAALSRVTTPAEIAEVVIARALPVLGADGGALYGRDGDDLVLAGSAGMQASTAAAWQRVPVTAPMPVADATRTGQPVLLRTAEEVPARYPALAEWHARRRYAAIASYPLTAGDRPLGALSLAYRGAQPFDDAQVALHGEVATRVADALLRGHVFEAEQRSRREHEVRSRLAAALAAAPAPEDVAVVAGVQLCAIFGATVCAVGVVEGDWVRLLLVPPSPSVAPRWRRTRRSSATPLHESLTQVAPVSFTPADLAGDRYNEEFVEICREHDVVSGVAVPLAGGRSGISLGFPMSRTLTDEEDRVLAWLADQVAQSLDRSLAFEAEQEARRRFELLEANASRLAATMTVAQVGEVLVSDLEAFGFALVRVALRRGDLVETVALSDAVAPGDERRHAPLPLSLPLPAHDAIRTGAPVELRDGDARLAHLPVLAVLRGTGVQTAYAVPIVDRRTRDAVGALTVASRRPGRFPDDLRVLLAGMAEQAAIALDRALRYEREQAAGASARAASVLHAAIAEAADPEDVARAIVTHVPAVTGAEHVAVAVRGAEVDRFNVFRRDPTTVLAVLGLDLDSDRRTPLLGVVRTGAAVVVADRAELVSSWPDLAAQPFVDGMASAAYFPFPADEEGRLGAMGFGFRSDDAFTAERVTALEALATACGQAVSRAAASRAERHARERTEALQRLTSALAAALTLDDLRAALRTVAGAVFGGADVWVRLADHDAGTLQLLMATTDAGAAGVVDVVPLDADHPSAAVARSCEPLFFERARNAMEAFPRWELPGRQGFSSFALVPLLSAGRVEGVLAVTYPTPHSFGLQERTLLGAFGDVLAQAVERVRLADREHTVALRLQEALLARPQPVPGVEIGAVYRPAARGLNIGGDWFDVIDRPDGSVGVMIGDVVGHSLDAAAVMGKLSTSARTLASEIDDPAALVARLGALYAHDRGVTGTTLVYGVISRDRDRFRFCCAGHLPPLLVEPSGVARFLERPRRGPLNSQRAPVYETGEVALEAGATLVLYTDGLVERRREVLDEGLDRLASAAAAERALPPQALADRLTRRLLGGYGQTDDTALLVARIATPVFEAVIPATPADVSAVRRRLRRRLLELAVPDDEVDRTVLAVSEAMTNAVEHAYRGAEPGPVQVTAYRDGDALDIQVADEGTWWEGPSHVLGGRGAHVMARAADALDIHSSDHGTVVRLRVLAHR